MCFVDLDSLSNSKTNRLLSQTTTKYMPYVTHHLLSSDGKEFS